MKKYLLSLLIISTSFLIYEYSFADVVINPQKLYKEGIMAYEDENYRKAVRLLEDAVKRGLSGKELTGAYLRLYLGALKLNDAPKAAYWREKCRSVIPGFDEQRNRHRSLEDMVAKKIDKKYRKILQAYLYSFNYGDIEALRSIGRTKDGQFLTEDRINQFRETNLQWHKVYGDITDVTVVNIAEDQDNKNAKTMVLKLDCEKEIRRTFHSGIAILLKDNNYYILFD